MQFDSALRRINTEGFVFLTTISYRRKIGFNVVVAEVGRRADLELTKKSLSFCLVF